MLIGIDTSCYTTSLALIDLDQGIIIHDFRRLLQVKLGRRGLRQSEAVFQHLQNLPQLVESFAGCSIHAVAASTMPRPVTDSYLPVFKAGASFGLTLSRLLGVPFYETSHQEGHIRAGFFEQPGTFSQAFLAWHISGGTTELLLVHPEKAGYRIEKVGGSSDLQVGQFIDRVGVALGSPFPAGPALEKMALLSGSDQSLPIVTQGLTTSFSGPDSAAQRLIKSGMNESDLARQVFNCISQSLLKVTLEAAKKYKISQVLMVGGVASNQIIRATLKNEGLRAGIEFLFAKVELSSDNAVGVGLIGYDEWQNFNS